MLWQEVRETYPKQYVLVQALKSHTEGNKKYVDEVVIIRLIRDAQEATKELLHAKGNQFVYHTSKEQIVIELRTRSGVRVRGVQRYGN